MIWLDLGGTTQADFDMIGEEFGLHETGHRRRVARLGTAAIIAVPAAITGFYGQNLPYPASTPTPDSSVSAALILALSGLLYLT